jgi:uncharacterized cupin superfamily protein
VGIAHLDNVPSRAFELGHLRGRWSFPSDAAGNVGIGMSRIEVPAGGWSTPAHEHGREEELFYVLAGRGLSWQDGTTSEIGPGDCIVYRAGAGAHTLHALEPLDVLAFGTRWDDEALRFPRLGLSKLGGRAVESSPGAVDGVPIQFLREAELGPPELPVAGPRRKSIVNTQAVEPRPFGRGERVEAARRNLGAAVGSLTTGLQHVEVAAGKQATPAHCHSLEEEMFVILSGEGALVLDERDAAPVKAGTVVGRPPATGVAHHFLAGQRGLTYLAYGTRESGDMCYYPRSNKVSFRGLGVIARLERLDYWDGEE